VKGEVDLPLFNGILTATRVAYGCGFVAVVLCLIIKPPME
jgi:hypothetical protein